MKKILILILFLLLTGCKNEETKIDTNEWKINNIYYESNVLNWDKVKNALGYNILIEDKVYTSSKNSFLIEEDIYLNYQGTYITIKIAAKNNRKLGEYSEPFYVLLGDGGNKEDIANIFSEKNIDIDLNEYLIFLEKNNISINEALDIYQNAFVNSKCKSDKVSKIMLKHLLLTSKDENLNKYLNNSFSLISGAVSYFVNFYQIYFHEFNQIIDILNNKDAKEPLNDKEMYGYICYLLKRIDKKLASYDIDSVKKIILTFIDLAYSEITKIEILKSIEKDDLKSIINNLADFINHFSNLYSKIVNNFSINDFHELINVNYCLETYDYLLTFNDINITNNAKEEYTKEYLIWSFKNLFYRTIFLNENFIIFEGAFINIQNILSNENFTNNILDILDDNKKVLVNQIIEFDNTKLGEELIKNSLSNSKINPYLIAVSINQKYK